MVPRQVDDVALQLKWLEQEGLVGSWAAGCTARNCYQCEIGELPSMHTLPQAWHFTGNAIECFAVVCKAFELMCHNETMHTAILMLPVLILYDK